MQDDGEKWPKTREEALLKGMMFYNSGVPCRKGHLSLRYASSGNCLQCMKERNESFRVLREEGKRRKYIQAGVASYEQKTGV